MDYKYKIVNKQKNRYFWLTASNFYIIINHSREF